MSCHQLVPSSPLIDATIRLDHHRSSSWCQALTAGSLLEIEVLACGAVPSTFKASA